MIAQEQLQHIKQTVDMHALASRYTTLHKASRAEWAGPCPNCNGDDRFHAHADGWWFCRNCHTKRGDQIELVRFAEGVDFATACQILGALKLDPVPAAKPARATRSPDEWKTERWQLRASEVVTDAAAALDAERGAPGRAYLTERGIMPDTWRAWLLGYAPISPPWNKEQRRRVGEPSITIPYLTHDDDRLLAVRYRRIDPHIEQRKRYINEPDSYARVLHGLHLVNLNAPTLVIVEGEVNAISCWQAAQDLGVAVVSIGSQSVAPETLRCVSWLSTHFERCITWCDAPSNTLEVRAAVRSPLVLPLQSPQRDGAKIDANDMLRQGVLRAFLERKLGHVESRKRLQ